VLYAYQEEAKRSRPSGAQKTAGRAGARRIKKVEKNERVREESWRRRRYETAQQGWCDMMLKEKMAQATAYECAAQMRNLAHLLPPTSGIAMHGVSS
jgi:hypothetical protein